MEFHGDVYTIRCVPTGVRYIGNSRNSIRVRLGGHLSSLRNGKHPNKALQSDWDTFGPESFDAELIETDIPASEVVIREALWITYFARQGHGVYNTRVISDAVKLSDKSLLETIGLRALARANYRLHCNPIRETVLKRAS